MGKIRVTRPIMRTRDVHEALARAISRAVFKADAATLRDFRLGHYRRGCRSLAGEVVRELRGDGWFERQPRMGFADLEVAMADGMEKAGADILAGLPAVHRCDNTCEHRCEKAALDSIGAHLGSKALKAMAKADVGLVYRSHGQ